MRSKLSDDDVTQRLAAIPLFSGLKPKHLKLIAQQSKVVEFGAGDEICKEGESGVGMHVIAEGAVTVSIAGEKVRDMGPGSFFGEIALLDGGPRSATVVANDEVTTVSIPFWNFKNLLNEYPEIAVMMLEETTRRLRGKSEPEEL